MTYNIMPATIDWIILFAFILISIGIGYIFRGQAGESMSNFWLAGRRIGLALSTATIMATWFGIDVTIGFAEMGFNLGLAAGLVWIVPYYAMRIPFFLWIPIVRNVLPDGVDTMPDFIDYLYGGKGFMGKLGSLLAALMTAFLSGSAMHFLAMGMLISHLTGWNVVYITVAIAFITVLYTTLGGLYSVAITDFLQFVVMTATVGICIPNALQAVGGWAGMQASIADPQYFTWSGGSSISSLLMWNFIALSIYVDPALYQRFQSAKNSSTATVAFLICMPVWITFAICTVMVGIIGKAMYPNLEAYQAVINVYLGNIPPVLTGLWLAGFFAAGMSCQDSYLLIFGTTVAKDIYKKFINKNASSETVLKVARWCIIIWGPFIAYVYASGFNSVIQVLAFLYSFYTSALLIPVAFGLMYTGKKTAASGTLAMIGGITSYIVFAKFLTVPFGLPSLVVNWIISLIMFFIGTFIGEDVKQPWNDDMKLSA